MSGIPSRARAAWRDRGAEDAGFTLIEVIVALVIFGLAAQGVLVLLVTGARSTQVVKTDDTAKNIAQQQIESMTALPYHVSARTSGTTTDLLDAYFPSLTAAASSTSTGYVAAGSAARTALEPSTGAFYRTYTAALPSPNAAFAMTVDTQFLQTSSTSTSAVPVVPASTYNSSTAGSDAPPTQQVGVTIVVSWSTQGAGKTYRVFSQLADTDQSQHGSTAQTQTGQLITSQARSQAISLLTYVGGYESSILAGGADADGNVATTASASGDAQGGAINPSTASGYTPVTGATSSVGAPPTATSGGASSGGLTLASDLSCTLACIGPTQADAETASVSGNLPIVDRSGGSGTGVIGRVLRQGCTSGCSRLSKGMSVGNSSSLANQPTYQLANGLFFLNDAASGDDADGTAYVGATAGSSHAVTATATALTQRIDAVPTTSTPSGAGLIYVTLTAASLTCTANATTQTATASYSGTISYYGLVGRSYAYTTISFSYSNGALTYSNGTGLPALSTVQVANNTYLSSYFTDWSIATAPKVTVNSTTKTVSASLPAVVNLTTQPSSTTDSSSQWTLQVGSLSCIAQDAR